MLEFARTIMGKTFFEGTIPRLIKSLERIADALEKANAMEEEYRVGQVRRMVKDDG